MCGFCGTISWRGDADPDAIAPMVAALRHRGPDAAGQFVEGGVALGHARLSILDLDGRADQPLRTPDGRLVLAYNGEVYNFPELRRELESRGAVFRTRSDTEVILEGYRAWGAGVVQRLRGMFAFALLDRARGRLLLARDRLGIKPLYLHRAAGGWVFGSEAKALLAHPAVPRAVEPSSLASFLYFGNTYAPQTLFRGIEKFPPAYYVEVDLATGRDEWVRYWRAPAAASRAGIRPEEAVAELRGRLVEVVRCHLLADVEVGAFLSGGVDSGAVVALMAREMGTAPRTFSVEFAEAGDRSELPAARLVARAAGARHEELRIHSGEVPGILEDVVHHFDEPFGDAASVPVYLLARRARQDVKVVLTGEGGDELFAGYRRYTSAGWAPARAALVRAAARALRPFVQAPAAPERLRRQSRVFAEGDGGRRAARWLSPFTGRQALLRGVLRPEFRAVLDAGEERVLARFAAVNAEAAGADPVNRMLYVDQRTLLVDTYLEKVDKSTMAFGLEARVPLLDHHLLEFAMSLPGDLKIRGGRKWVMKEALRGVVPDEILSRPKQGFGVPVSAWFRGDLRTLAGDVFAGDLASGEFVDPPAVRALLARHVSGAADNGTLLWFLLNLELWHRAFIRPPAALAAA